MKIKKPSCSINIDFSPRGDFMLPQLCSCIDQKMKFESSWFHRLNYRCRPKTYCDFVADMMRLTSPHMPPFTRLRTLADGDGVCGGLFKVKMLIPPGCPPLRNLILSLKIVSERYSL